MTLSAADVAVIARDLAANLDGLDRYAQCRKVRADLEALSAKLVDQSFPSPDSLPGFPDFVVVGGDPE